MSLLTALPGFVEETRGVRRDDGDGRGVEHARRVRVRARRARLRDALRHRRHGLSDWGGKGVSGYIATASGRDINFPSTQGLQTLPEVKPKRFSVSYHLLALRQPPERVRLKCWVDDGEPVPSVVSVWPTADWHEREQFDLMGIAFTGHPNLSRILMEDDWDGHPLRKDYPLGGEPVRFSDAQ